MTVYDGQQTTFRDLDGWLLGENEKVIIFMKSVESSPIKTNPSIIGQAVVPLP